MATNVLIVLDGGYRFTPGHGELHDFTFTTLVGALQGAGMQVTRAHRLAAGDGDMGWNDFHFDAHDLLQFDVVWMIGHSGRNEASGSTVSSGAGIPPGEIDALTRFMNAGGGVFATGDHDSIGSEMCGRVPRVRTMRAWFGQGDGARSGVMPANFPFNFPRDTSARADTTRRGALTTYTAAQTDFAFFENQSDSTPQPIVPTTSPAHPILRSGGADITIFPDHMHEGKLLGKDDVPDLAIYETTYPLDGGTLDEFPALAGSRTFPEIIAKATTTGFTNSLDAAPSTEREINALCTYDGRQVGVGRVVTGATFHHYIDINLIGDSTVSGSSLDTIIPDAGLGEGYAFPSADPAVFATIKAVFVNITQWLARPRPAITLILERSTFGEDEVGSGQTFNGAVLVTVDGFKPSLYPGGPITTLSPSAALLAQWAPHITLPAGAGFVIEPTGIDSDDPALLDHLQRFTFTYRVRFPNANVFSGAPDVQTVQVDAALGSLTDRAWVSLVKSANPFMRDLANGNEASWLSSDVRSFPVVAGQDKFGVHLPNNANKNQALQFIRDLVNSMSVGQFESLDMTQSGSALSPAAVTTSGKKVYNFAVARVRLNGQVVTADDVRVFFRIFSSQTTAALTYQLDGSSLPIGGYKRTTGVAPIALPGESPGTSDWLSFPFFSEARAGTPAGQADGNNVKDIAPTPGSEVSTFFGALIDNNLSGAGEEYQPAQPGGGGPNLPISTLLTGEHQCLIAQIEFAGTPIPNGALPHSSDKLAQRNLAFSTVANPGVDGSRTAMHTFQLEAAPRAISAALPPDELLLQWRGAVPEEAVVRLIVPGWKAQEVIALADRFYPRHEIEADGDDTVLLPAGGLRYVPVPRSGLRQTGVLTVEFPLGIKKGQRFDLAVRQVTSRQRRVPTPSHTTHISLEEAKKLLAANGPQPTRGKAAAAVSELPGVHVLNDGRKLVMDVSRFDAAPGDFAILIKDPSPEEVARAQRLSGDWRETIGAFQLGIPVSDKVEMLTYHLQLLSIMRWRLGHLPRRNGWHATMSRYVALLIEKVLALGGDPYGVPATPDGVINVGGKDDDGDGKPDTGGTDVGEFEPGDDDWLGETGGLGDPGKAGARALSGKVSGLLFDHFGDFEGFTLETYGGQHARFFSREAAIRELAQTAWIGRYVVTVITVGTGSRQVRRLLLRGYPD